MRKLKRRESRSSKRSFKRIIVGLFFLFLIGIGVIGYFSYFKNGSFFNLGEVDYLTQIITSDMKHSRTISWQAKNFDESFEIEFRKKGDFTSRSQKVTVKKMPVTQGEELFIYTAQLEQLEAGAEYEYRVVSGWKKSSWKQIKTEPEGNRPFKVLIFGDSQSADYSWWGKVSQAAWERNQDASFFINVGDLVDNGQQIYQWDTWRREGKSLFSNIPIAPVMGNHETYSLDWKMAKPDNYLTLFTLPSNGPEGLEGHAYSFDYGDVHFVVVNTQQKELKEWYPDLFEKQRKWLADDLEKNKKKWVVALLHKDVWDWPYNSELDEIGRAFVPILDEYGVDLVFMGHIHSYGRTNKVLRGAIPAAKAPVLMTAGRSGDRVWRGSPRKSMEVVFHNPIEQPMYLTLEASNENLQVKAFKLDGMLIDQVVIEK